LLISGHVQHTHLLYGTSTYPTFQQLTLEKEMRIQVPGLMIRQIKYYKNIL